MCDGKDISSSGSRSNEATINQASTSMESWQLQETDFGKFTAEKAVSKKDYLKQVNKKKSDKKRKEQWSGHSEK
jgi:hypothetical protein